MSFLTSSLDCSVLILLRLIYNSTRCLSTPNTPDEPTSHSNENYAPSNNMGQFFLLTALGRAKQSGQGYKGIAAPLVNCPVARLHGICTGALRKKTSGSISMEWLKRVCLGII